MLHNARDHCTMMRKERSERRFRNVDNGYCCRTGKSREWKVSPSLSLSYSRCLSLCLPASSSWAQIVCNQPQFLKQWGIAYCLCNLMKSQSFSLSLSGMCRGSARIAGWKFVNRLFVRLEFIKPGLSSIPAPPSDLSLSFDDREIIKDLLWLLY